MSNSVIYIPGRRVPRSENGVYVPVGETVIVDDKEYVCVTNNPHRCCQDCDLHLYIDGIPECKVLGRLMCAPFGRHDKTDVVFKEIDSDDVTEK